MALTYRNLDEKTRLLMLEEINSDITKGTLYISPRLNDTGKAGYPQELINCVATGTDAALEDWISRGHLNLAEQKRTKNGYTTAQMPITAAETLSEGEFNRFYIRALCCRALNDGHNNLIIYRAKQSNHPRPESESKIGQSVDAQALLNDLRNNIGINTALGIPGGPNSGISIELIN